MGIHGFGGVSFLQAGSRSATPVPASCLLREQGACQERSQRCHCPRTSHRGSIQTCQAWQVHPCPGAPAPFLSSGWLPSACRLLQRASPPVSSPRVLQDFTSRTGKQKQKGTARLFYYKVQERGVNARAIIQAGTWSWKAFSSQTRPKAQHLALCCSFIHRVIFGFLLLGEQDSFCLRCSLESSLLRE